MIPVGEFMMGSPKGEEGRFDDEEPQHWVTIGRRFAIGRYPVTFDEYDRFCEAMGRGEARRRRQGARAGGRSSMSAATMLRSTSPGCRMRSGKPIGSPRKRNGNMPAAPALRAGIRLATRLPQEIPITTVRIWAIPAKSAPTRQTPGVSMTCTATSGSGSWMIGTQATRPRRWMDQCGRMREQPAIPAVACCAAAPGSAIRGAAGPPTAEGRRLCQPERLRRVPSRPNTFLILEP